MVIGSVTGALGAGSSSPESRANVAPVTTLQGDTVDGKHVRSVRAGEPLSFTTQLTDDGIPKTRSNADTVRMIAASRGEDVTEQMVQNQMALRIPWQPTVQKLNGLFLSWNVYRGPGKATFSPPQPKSWEDTRPGSNSAWGLNWSPPIIPGDGMIGTTVTFDEPGEYVLWGRGDDGIGGGGQRLTMWAGDQPHQKPPAGAGQKQGMGQRELRDQCPIRQGCHGPWHSAKAFA